MTESKKFLYPAKWLLKAAAGERVTCKNRMRIISGLIESGTTLSSKL